MSHSPEELENLWNLALGPGGLDAAQGERLEALMADPALVDTFTQAQAAASPAEPEQALSDGQWAQVDAKVGRGFQAFLKPWWAKPWVWGLAAVPVVLGAGTALYFHSRASAEQALETLVDDRPFEIRPDRRAVHAPRVHRPQAAPSPSQKMALLPPAPQVTQPHFADRRKARKISVVIDRPAAGPVQVVVTQPGGALVRTLYSGPLKAGKWKFEWNGLDETHAAVKPGRYQVEVRSESGTQAKDIEVSRK